jgi:signal transduction histidine kinase
MARAEAEDVSIGAPFYRSRWFLPLCALEIAGLVALSWRLRMAALIRARAAQRQFSQRLIQSQEIERKRLAGELHDGLAQRLTIVKNLLLMQQLAPDRNSANRHQRRDRR